MTFRAKIAIWGRRAGAPASAPSRHVPARIATLWVNRAKKFELTTFPGGRSGAPAQSRDLARVRDPGIRHGASPVRDRRRDFRHQDVVSSNFLAEIAEKGCTERWSAAQRPDRHAAIGARPRTVDLISDFIGFSGDNASLGGRWKRRMNLRCLARIGIAPVCFCTDLVAAASQRLGRVQCVCSAIRSAQTCCVTRLRVSCPLAAFPGCDTVRRKIGANDAGWSSLVARRAHNPEAAGSNPAPATKNPQVRGVKLLAFFFA